MAYSCCHEQTLGALDAYNTAFPVGVLTGSRTAHWASSQVGSTDTWVQDSIAHARNPETLAAAGSSWAAELDPLDRSCNSRRYLR